MVDRGMGCGGAVVCRGGVVGSGGAVVRRGGMVGSRGGTVVSWGSVVGSSVVGGRVGRSLSMRGVGGARAVVGLAGVGNISNIARVSISHVVGHCLGAAVGQDNGVGSARGVTVALLILVEVSAAVLVVHTIFKGILCWHGLLLVLGLGVSVASGVTSLMMIIGHDQIQLLTICEGNFVMLQNV